MKLRTLRIGVHGEDRTLLPKNLRDRGGTMRLLLGDDPAAFLRSLRPVGRPAGPDRLIETLDALLALDQRFRSEKAEELAAEKRALLCDAGETTRQSAASPKVEVVA